MSDWDNDPILDSSLEEVLGGPAPPDLSAQILARLAQQPDTVSTRSSADGASDRNGTLSGNNTNTQYAYRPRRSATMWNAALAVGVTLAIFLIVIAAFNGPVSNQPEGVANTTVKEPTGLVVNERDRQNAPSAPPSNSQTGEPKPNQISHQAIDENGGSRTQDGPAKDQRKQGVRQVPDVVANGDSGTKGRVLPAPDSFGPPRELAPQVALRSADEVKPRYVAATRLAADEVVLQLDEHLNDVWQESSVTPARAAQDNEWLRRVYLRMLGRIPTIKETRRFLAASGSSRRAVEVKNLTHKPEFATHWATVWADILVGKSGSMSGGDMAGHTADRSGLVHLLAEAISSDKPWDEVAYELVSAVGSNSPQAPDYNPATNFLLANMGPDSIVATDRVSRIFMGKQIRCVQCHDHPDIQQVAQQEFWELNSFLRQTQVEQQEDGVRLVDRDFAGGGRTADEAEVYYELRNGLIRVAYPAFPGAPPIDKSGEVGTINRRQVLARLIVTSDDFAKAVTNRTWLQFFGQGLTHPVDDMGSHNPSVAEPLLEHLAEQFRAHDHSVKSLVQWIALSEPFGLSSQVPQDAIAGGPKLFNYYYTRQIDARAVYQSLMVVAGAREAGGEELLGQMARKDMSLLVRPSGTDEGEELDFSRGNLRGSQIIMSSPIISHVTSVDHDTLLKRVIDSKMTLDEKVDHLFLAAVTRPPRDDERQVVRRLIKSNGGSESAALQDIWWALVNSSEFMLDH